jgi:BolA family transcriptional regulator, general stress-responsive regulator
VNEIHPEWVGAAEIEAALRAAFNPQELRVEDESHQHAGHAGATSGGHFRVTIRAACFAGQTRLARHRLVYDSLAFLMPRGIHALAIVAEATQDVSDVTPGGLR